MAKKDEYQLTPQDAADLRLACTGGHVARVVNDAPPVHAGLAQLVAQ